MIDYLLGRLPEAERELVSERILTDENAWQAALDAEETLIDEYAAGGLDDADARLVEARLLSTEQGQARLRTARALVERQRREDWLRRRFWLSVAAAVLVGCGFGLAVFSGRLRPLAVPAPSIAAVTLRLDVARGESAVPVVSLPFGVEKVEFRVPLAEADRAGRYEVLVKSADRRELSVAGRELRTAGALALGFELDRRFLTPGRYEIEASAIDGTGRRLIAFGPVNLR